MSITPFHLQKKSENSPSEKRAKKSQQRGESEKGGGGRSTSEKERKSGKRNKKIKSPHNRTTHGKLRRQKFLIRARRILKKGKKEKGGEGSTITTPPIWSSRVVKGP